MCINRGSDVGGKGGGQGREEEQRGIGRGKENRERERESGGATRARYEIRNVYACAVSLCKPVHVPVYTRLE